MSKTRSLQFPSCLYVCGEPRRRRTKGRAPPRARPGLRTTRARLRADLPAQPLCGRRSCWLFCEPHNRKIQKRENKSVLRWFALQHNKQFFSNYCGPRHPSKYSCFYLATPNYFDHSPQLLSKAYLTNKFSLIVSPCNYNNFIKWQHWLNLFFN